MNGTPDERHNRPGDSQRRARREFGAFKPTKSEGVSTKKKTPAFLHGVFRRGENAPSRSMS
jgi:hypothetical protein